MHFMGGAPRYLFENDIQVIFQLNGRVRVVELAKHYTLRRNDRAEQLHHHIGINVTAFGLLKRSHNY